MRPNPSSSSAVPGEERIRSAPIYLRTWRWIAGLGVGAILIAGHIYTYSQGPAYTGALRVLDHLFAIAAVTVFLVLCQSLGDRLLTVLKADTPSPLDRLVLAIALGAAGVSVGILLLGLLGVLTAPALSVTFILLFLWLRGEIGTSLTQVKQAGSFLTEQAGGPFGTFALLICGSVVLFMIAQAVAPPTDWDSLMYHLQIPRQFLESGRIFLPEDNMHVAFIGLPQLLYIPFLALHSVQAPALLSVSFALLLALAVFSIALQLFGPRTATLSTALLWGTPIVMLVAITPRVDVTLVLFLFLAHYLVLSVALGSAGRRELLLAGLLLGLAVGIKYHALVYAAALAPLVVWASHSNSRTVPGTTRALAAIGLAALVGASPWLLKNLVLLKAPLYPLLAETRVEPWIATVLGSTRVPESVNPEVFGAISHARSPFDLLDLFFAPGRITVEAEGSFYYANPLLLSLVLWPFFIRNRSVNAIAVPTVTYVLLILVPSPLTNTRYLLPALVPLTVVAVYMVSRAADRWLSSGPAGLLVLGLGLLSLIPAGKTVYHWMTERRVLSYAVGLVSQKEYLSQGFAYYGALTETVNEHVPKDGKVLLLFEARGYYFEPAVIQDNRLTNWPLVATHAAEGNCLQAAGITHVLVSNLAIRYYALRGMDPSLLQLGLFREFARRCLDGVYGNERFVLFRIDPGGSREASTESGPSPGNGIRADRAILQTRSQYSRAPTRRETNRPKKRKQGLRPFSPLAGP